MPQLPTGAVTFLFTDIESSSRLWEEHPEWMRQAVERHDHLIRSVVEAGGGAVFKTVGDAFYTAFSDPSKALRAAIEAQQGLHALPVPATGSDRQLRVRMALHTGTADVRNDDYFGPALNRVARLLSSGHGGQVLLSLAT